MLNEVEYQLLVLECDNVTISVDKNQAVIEGYKKEDPAQNWEEIQRIKGEGVKVFWINDRLKNDQKHSGNGLILSASIT